MGRLPSRTAGLRRAPVHRQHTASIPGLPPYTESKEISILAILNTYDTTALHVRFNVVRKLDHGSRCGHVLANLHSPTQIPDKVELVITHSLRNRTHHFYFANKRERTRRILEAASLASRIASRIGVVCVDDHEAQRAHSLSSQASP